MATAKLGPCGSEAVVDLQTSLIQLSCVRELVVASPQLVSAKVELVRPRVARRARHWGRLLASQGEREGLHHPAREIILQPEEVVQWRLNGMRCQERPAGSLDQLR